MFTDLGTSMTNKALVQLNQNIYQEEDETKHCVNYPNSNYKSYGDCDDSFSWRFVPKGIHPIWLEDDLEKVTVQESILDKYLNFNAEKYADLMAGDEVSDCPLPCSTTFVKTKVLEESLNGRNNSILKITFSPTIHVTTTSFIKFELAKFLSDLGGSLGLWMGISLLQVVELFVKALHNVGSN